VSTGDPGRLAERWFILLQRQRWRLVLLIDLRRLSALWQQVSESETAVQWKLLNLVKLLWCRLWNRERQFHHSLSAGDFSYSWGNLLKNHQSWGRSLQLRGRVENAAEAASENRRETTARAEK